MNQNPTSLLQRLLQILCKLLTVIAIVFAVVCILFYSIRFDRFSAFTFLPAWLWLCVGLISTVLIAFIQRNAAVVLLGLWSLFVVLHVEEAFSLVRAAADGVFASASKQADRQITIVSLNCLGGQIKAARETASHAPDIVLLQETPSVLVDLQNFADELFVKRGHVLLGADNTILSRFPIEVIPVVGSTNWVHARVKLPSGNFVRVISLRLKPPVIDIDLHSAACWRAHFEDRVLRRESIQSIRDQIESVPSEEQLIVGGDFNVPAFDGCLSPLRDRLIDAFSVAGRGWGNTVLNDLPLFRIDQIWISNEFHCDSVRAFKSRNSDHRLVVCKLRY